MLSLADLTIQRLAKYPALRTHITDDWIRTAAQNAWVTSWHPFFTDDPPDIMGRLNAAIEYLQNEGIAEVGERAQRLMRSRWNNYQGAEDELLQGENLRRRGYRFEFVAEVQGTRTPDMRLSTQGIWTGIEFRSVNTAWGYKALPRYLRSQLMDINESYHVSIEAWSDLVTVSEPVVRKLADDIRQYIKAGPYPIGTSMTINAQTTSGNLEVEIISSNHADYIANFGLAGDGFQPSWMTHADNIANMILDKSQQLLGYQHGVVVINLAQDTITTHLLTVPGLGDQIWPLVEVELAKRLIPSHVEAVALSWGNGPGRIYRQPGSQWNSVTENQQLTQALAEGRLRLP